ncbi:MAG: tetraacyldisaccharide 4'-kinase [Malikia sp.]|nr:tetraacyldisaccharide 4'-kinase [Malikia sp.]MDD2728459.1 tetraacyldisaccharide 4'-kinase [Malikia sp.]
MSARLQQAWLRRGPLAALLWPVSQLYATLTGLRRLAYRTGCKRSERLPVPVLVVGNVVVGGAGKTPTVIALLRHLRARGWTPGVISRGYGREGDGCLEITPDSSSREAGDEPLLIARATGAPMVVGRRRAEAGRLLLARHPEVDLVICDDGMQHWALARDLTVVVFDERGTGNGWLLPAGLLREPWPARPWGDGAGELLVLRTARPGVELPPLLPARPGGSVHAARRELAAEAVDARGLRCTLAELALAEGVETGALAGIAQPQRFFEMLRARGLAPQQELALPDHADGPALLATLLAGHRPGRRWFCTEKDAVKLFPLLSGQPELAVWAVPLVQTPEAAFWNEFDRALERARERLSSRHGRQTP